jgi:6-phosphogluconolactonase (cycloisomerase 2 family)
MTSCGGGTVGYMWVLGTQYNQIGGFKIDDYTGNLTATVGSPYPSGGTNPVMLTLKSGGRYLYVLNAGNATTPGNFSLFSVGGDGTLSYQQSYTSQGTNPVWITTDTTGNYLFVLDQKAPDYDGVTNFNGSITAFALDANTGRPSLITNAQVKNAQGTQLTYFEVGKNPTQMRNSASCIYTLDSGDQTIFPSSLDSTSGQLTANPTVALGTASATSVNISGGYIYVTDAGSTVGGSGSILSLAQGSSCAALAPGSTVANLPNASDPVQTIATADGKYLYVLNHSTLNTNYANSSISAFSIQSGGVLTPVVDAASTNPYAVGSGPTCAAIDPTNQYIYTSDQFASTVTGKRITSGYGYLQDLTKGTSFPTVGTPSCLVISGNTGS